MYLKVNNSYGFFMNNIYIYIGKSETICNGLSKQYSKHWKKLEVFFWKKEVLCQYFQNLIQHVSNE